MSEERRSDQPPEAGGAERFPLIFTQGRVLPVAVALALAGAGFSEDPWLRLGCAVVATLAVGALFLLKRGRPELLLDQQGYAVCEHGREKLRVTWQEVRQVRVDPAEHALYVDCGDPARNLLVPPRRGYGFRFARPEALYARVTGAVPERITEVERLDPRPSPKLAVPPSAPAPADAADPTP